MQAVMYIREGGMSAASREEEDSSVSAGKEEGLLQLPDGSTETFVLSAMTPEELTEFQKKIAYWEKTSLLERMASGELKGAIRSTGEKNGGFKEWDHLQYSIDREGSEHHSEADLDKIRKIIVDIAAKDESGKHLKMAISRIHTDTGNSHIDVFVHRHAFDNDKKFVFASDSLVDRSRIVSIVDQINGALASKGFATIADTKKRDGRSVYEETATSDAAKDLVNQLVTEEGGVPTQRTGGPRVPGDDSKPTPAGIVDPDIKTINRLLLDAEREMKAAAQRFVSAQNAKAVYDEREKLRASLEAEQKTVAELEAALTHNENVRVEEQRIAADALAAKDLAIEAAQQREFALSTQLENEKNTVAELGQRVEGLTSDVDAAEDEIKGLKSSLSTVTSERDTAVSKATALDADLKMISAQRDELAAALDAEKDQVATQAKEIDAYQQTISGLNIENANLDSNLKKSTTQIEVLKDKVDDLEKTVSSNADEIEILTGQRDNAKTELGMVSAEVAEKTALLRERDAAIAKKDADIEAARSMLSMRDDELRKQIAAADDQRKQMSELMAQTNQMLASMQAERESARVLQAEQAAQIASLAAQLKQLSEAGTQAAPVAPGAPQTAKTSRTMTAEEAAELKKRADNKKRGVKPADDSDGTPPASPGTKPPTPGKR